MSTHARQAVSADRIDPWLPQMQCTQCGYPRCRDYAEAVAVGSAGINQCPPGGEVTIAALAKLLNVPSEPLNPRFGMHKPRARAVIDETVCIGCRKCLDVCPVDAIVGARKLMHTVIADECNGCELCLPPCPVDCIAMQPVDPASDSGPWPEYTRTEADRWRARTENRLHRLAQRKRARGNSHLSDTAPASDRERIRAEIRAAVARVKARKSRPSGPGN